MSNCSREAIGMNCACLLLWKTVAKPRITKLLVNIMNANTSPIPSCLTQRLVAAKWFSVFVRIRQSLAVAAILTICLGLVSSALATNYDWIGGTSQFWNNNANWSPNTGSPVANDTALFGVNSAVNLSTCDLGGTSQAAGGSGNNSGANSAFRFGTSGGLTNYTVQNGTVNFGTVGNNYLVGKDVTLTLNNLKNNITTAGNSMSYCLSTNATLNIAGASTSNGRFVIYPLASNVTCVVNLNATNYLVGGGANQQIQVQGSGVRQADMTLNINANNTSGAFAFSVGDLTNSYEARVNVRNGATLSIPARPQIGANGGVGRLVIGDAGSVGTVNISSSAATVRIGNGNTNGIGIVDVVNGTLSMAGSTVGAIILPSAGASTGYLNIFTNGTVTTSYSFTLNTTAGSVGIMNFYGGRLLANSGLGTLQAGNWLDATLPVYVYDGGAVLDSNGKTITINAGLLNPGSSIGGLTVQGSGTVILNGPNTFTGPTIVKAGTFQAGSSYTSLSPSITVSNAAKLGYSTTAPAAGLTNVVVADGGIIRSVDTTAGTTLNVSALTLGATTNGGVVNVQFNAGGSANDKITVASSGGLVLNGGKVNLYLENTTTPFALAGTYTLFNYSGALTGNATNLVVNNPVAGNTYTFNDTGSAITLTIAAASTVNQWAVNADGNWSSVGNWTLGVAPNAVDASALFGSIITTPHTVTVDAPETVGSVQFNNANSYTVAGSSALTLNSSSNAVVVATVGNHTISAPLVLATNAQFSSSVSGQTLTLAGDVSGSGTFLVTNNPGTVIIAGTNNTPVIVSGGTLYVTNVAETLQPVTILAGTVRIDTETNLGSNPAVFNANQLLLNGGTLRCQLAGAIANPNRGITIGTSNGTIQVDATLTMSNPIAGTGSLTKSGGGILQMAAANTYNGNTTISGGELQIGNGGTTGTLGAGTNVTISGGVGSVLTLNRTDLTSLTNSVTLGASGGTIRNSTGNPIKLAGMVNAASNSLTIDTISADIMLSGTNYSNFGNLTKTNGNNLVLSDNFTSSGTGNRIFVQQGTVAFASGANWNITGTVADTLRVGTLGNQGANVVVSNGANVTLSGAVVGYDTASLVCGLTVSGNLTLTGIAADVLTVNNGGPQGYPDYIEIDGGTLNAPDPGSRVNIGGRGDGIFTVNSGSANLNRVGFGHLTGGGTISLGNSSLTVNGGSMNISNQFDLLYDTSATAAYSVNVNLNGGSLNTVAMNCSSPAGIVTFNFNGGTLAALGNALTAGADGTGSLNNFLKGVATVNVQSGGAVIDTGANDVTINQGLQDAGGGSLTKLGSGKLSLTGTNTYGGNTMVQNGTLVLYPGHASPGNITGASGAGVGFHSTGVGISTFVPSASVTSGILQAEFAANGNPTAPAGYVTNLTLNGVIQVKVQAPLLSAGTIPLIGYSGSIAGSFSFATPVLPYGVNGTVVNNTGSHRIELAISSVTPLIWTGAANNLWDTSSTNWTFGGTPSKYQDGAVVVFNDSSTVTNVALSVVASPSSVIVSNSVNLYAISSSGPGKLTGNSGLTKQGTNTLLFSAASDFAGNALVQQGILQMGAANLGSSSSGSGLYVSSGAALDLNGQDLTTTKVFIAGSYSTNVGAVFASVGPGSNKGLKYLTLTADAAIGGGTNEFSVNAGVIDGAGHQLTKVGSGGVRFSASGGAGYATNLSAIVINGGSLMPWYSFNPELNCPVNLNAGTTISFGFGVGTPAVVLANTPITLSNATLACNSTNFTDYSPITLASGTTNSIVGQNSSFPGGILAGQINGGGSLQMSSQFQLLATNTYTGATICGGKLILGATGSISNSSSILMNVTNAILDVSAVSGGFTLNTNQTLAGVGSVVGNVATLAGSTISAGTNGGVGTLTFANNLTSAGNFAFNVKKGSSPSNSVLSVVGTLSQTGSGMMNITSLGTSLTVGDTFTVLSQNLTGGAALSIANPGYVTWANNLSTAASIQVASALPAPVADFAADLTNGLAPLAVTFTNLSTGTLTNELWTFGVGSTLNTNTLLNVGHTYLTGGTNTVTLLVTDSYGRTATATKTAYITVTVQTIPATGTNLTYTVGNGNITINWPSNYVGWILQAQTNQINVGLSVNTNDWHDVWASTNGASMTLPLDPANPSVFFRMRHP